MRRAAERNIGAGSAGGYAVPPLRDLPVKHDRAACVASAAARDCNPLCAAADPARRSDQRDAIGLETFFAVDHIDPDALTRPECSDAAAAQRGDVDEHILAAAVR